MRIAIGVPAKETVDHGIEDREIQIEAGLRAGWINRKDAEAGGLIEGMKKIVVANDFDERQRCFDALAQMRREPGRKPTGELAKLRFERSVSVASCDGARAAKVIESELSRS